MSDLSEKKCIPCEGGIPSFKIDEIHKYLKILLVERAMGLEPTTFSLATRRSTTELCPPI